MPLLSGFFPPFNSYLFIQFDSFAIGICIPKIELCHPMPLLSSFSIPLTSFLFILFNPLTKIIRLTGIIGLRSRIPLFCGFAIPLTSFLILFNPFAFLYSPQDWIARSHAPVLPRVYTIRKLSFSILFNP